MSEQETSKADAGKTDAGKTKDEEKPAKATKQPDAFHAEALRRFSKHGTNFAVAGILITICLLVFVFPKGGLPKPKLSEGETASVATPGPAVYPRRMQEEAARNLARRRAAQARPEPQPEPALPPLPPLRRREASPRPQAPPPLKIYRPEGAGRGRGTVRAGEDDPTLAALERITRSIQPPRLPSDAPAAQVSPAPQSTRRHLEAEPASAYQLAAGTAVPLVLAQELGSDVSGPVKAVVSRDVYDSVSHRHLLIPRGAVLLGEQVRQPGLGDPRLAVVWRRLVYPEGTSFTLGAQPAGSRDGSAGLVGKVDRHWGQRFGAAILLSLVGAGTQLALPDGRRGITAGDLRLDGGPSPQEVAAGELGLQLGRLSQELLGRHADLPPTVSLEAGARLHALLLEDLVFARPYAAPAS